MYEDENVLNYNNRFWFKIFIISLVLLIISYIFYAYYQRNPNGANFVGLLYGVLGLLAILLLMYYGIRKRTYNTTFGTLKGWLSFHIYIGVLTLVIVPMHAGFKFGINVHTLSFLLMAIVVLSGLFGTYFYINFPVKFTKYGKELLYDEFDDEINKFINQMYILSKKKSKFFVQKCEEAISYGVPKGQKAWQIIFNIGSKNATSESDYLTQINKDLHKIQESERDDYQRLAVLSLQKIELQNRFLAQMRIKNILEVWLYIHLPVSFAMLVALTIHIVSVIYYNGFSMFIP
ncbi:hypothetical protein MYX76_10810 [Desulfobacterota bacterium AH_259_B03_O07]|nr:hypothetical protein [Desulfobacterota bacterium AH_259_B03_O07]